MPPIFIPSQMSNNVYPRCVLFEAFAADPISGHPVTIKQSRRSQTTLKEFRALPPFLSLSRSSFEENLVLCPAFLVAWEKMPLLGALFIDGEPSIPAFFPV